MQNVLEITIFYHIDTIVDCGGMVEYARIINKI